MSNIQSVVITPGANSRDYIYLNVLSFLATNSQQVKVKCEQLGYNKKFNRVANDQDNARFGADAIDITNHKGQELTFEVEVTHSNGEPSVVNPPILCESEGHLHVSVDSEDGTDNDFDDAVVFFDLFTPTTRV